MGMGAEPLAKGQDSSVPWCFVLLYMGCCLFTCCGPENKAVEDGVAADPVAAVDAAGYLTAGIQPGNGGALGRNNFTLGINHNTTHGMVDPRGYLDGVPGTFTQIADPAELAVKAPEERMVLPPVTSIFSTRITSAPLRAASSPALRPARPRQ
jgi:hypothetical protein